MAQSDEERDNCQVCKGAHGGVLGNENVVDGVVICDYCTVAAMTGSAVEVEMHKALQERRLEDALVLVGRYREHRRALRAQATNQ
jgi:hypothetical protein